MRLKVLGSAGAEFPGHYPTAFLIDGTFLLDGGTIGARLSEKEQFAIKNILITHSHLDHIKAIPFLADNIVIRNGRHSVTLLGISETLDALKAYVLNDRLWPDFTRISAAMEPVVKMRTVVPGRSFSCAGYSVRAYRVNHTVPAVGYIVRGRDGRVLLYTGDTGPTDKIWSAAKKIDAVIAEVSFPNSMEALALKTGHLTSRLLAAELGKMQAPPGRVFVTHPKPQYIGTIRKEVGKIRAQRIEMFKDGKTYEI
ncbi:MAG: 3',5'-cyclic-nucleotide phosphodiesterase [Nitrospiraceae bacterium]|nr:3',5'-cyclic-nucleotide phosphodiesterase [Nitrospiraceae bacterium]